MVNELYKKVFCLFLSNMERKETLIRFKSLKTLNLERTQGMILACYNCIVPHRGKTSAFFSVPNYNLIESVNVIFLKDKPKHKVDCAILNEYLSYEEFKNYIWCRFDYKRSKLNEITKKSAERFILKDIRLAYSNYQLTIPSQVSLFEVETINFIEPIKETEHFLLAIDCEMLITERGKEIGRVSLLDHEGNIVFDKYVQPMGKVVDYLYQYSGLTEEKVSNGITFDQLQEKLLDLIGKNTILLGHGLENDLVLLKLKHNLLIDTSHIYKTYENKRRKLKDLTIRYIRKLVQEPTHSSLEDAWACLELLKYKIDIYRLAEEAYRNRKFYGAGRTVHYLDYKEVLPEDLVSERINFISAYYDEAMELITNKNDSTVFFVFFEDKGVIKMIKDF